MDSQFKICNQCGAKLAFEATACSRCGAPAPESFFVSQTADMPQPTQSSRRARFWLGLSAIIGGGLCACLAFSLMGVYAFGGGRYFTDRPPAAVQTSTQPDASLATPVATETVPTQTTFPTETTVPEAKPTLVIAPPTLEPTQNQPTATEATTSAANGADTGTAGGTIPGLEPLRFFDDFSDPASGWKRVAEATYSMDYTADESYQIVLTTADKMAVAYAPVPFTDPAGMIISVRARPGSANGSYGVMCQLQDQNNFYRVSFRENRYGIDKIINGQSIPLTEPFWKEIILFQPAEDGSITITLACLDGRIQLLVDEIGQEIITDTDLNSGDAAIFVAAGEQPGENGVYIEGTFDDFSAELP